MGDRVVAPPRHRRQDEEEKEKRQAPAAAFGPQTLLPRWHGGVQLVAVARIVERDTRAGACFRAAGPIDQFLAAPPLELFGPLRRVLNELLLFGDLRFELPLHLGQRPRFFVERSRRLFLVPALWRHARFSG